MSNLQQSYEEIKALWEQRDLALEECWLNWRKQMTKTIEELKEEVEKAEVNYKAAWEADVAAPFYSRGKSDAAWFAREDARKALETAKIALSYDPKADAVARIAELEGK